MNSVFETEGTWRIPGGSLVTLWAARPEFTPTECDVPFWFGPHYNYGDLDGMTAFIRDNKITSITEIVEVFREPRNDVDSFFRGRSLLVARFKDIIDAMMFKMAVPHPEPVDFQAGI